MCILDMYIGIQVHWEKIATNTILDILDFFNIQIFLYTDFKYQKNTNTNGLICTFGWYIKNC